MVVNVTIFGSGGEAHAVGMEGHRVNGTEMTLYVRKHFVVNNIIKLNIETTLLCSSGCYILCILPSTHQNVELLILISFIQRAHRAISAREIKLVISNLIKSLWMEQLACAITGAGEQHREVTSHVDGEDFILMNISDLLYASLLQIVLNESSSVRAVVDTSVE